MSNDSILYELNQGVATVTLNRPDVLNSFNRDMARALQTVIGEIADKPEVRAMLLTGKGRAFCAGQDLGEVSPRSDAPVPTVAEVVAESYNPLVRKITSLEKPVICAVNGVAAGAGANIALACDLVLAAETASFIQSFCHIGLIPDSGGTFFLPRLVGIPQAKAMMLLGDKISAQKAYEMGMIYQVMEGDFLQVEAARLAQKLASMPTRGLGLIKRALNASYTNDLDTQLELEKELQDAASSTSDYQEGVQAFLDKRKPVFRGN